VLATRPPKIALELALSSWSRAHEMVAVGRPLAITVVKETHPPLTKTTIVGSGRFLSFGIETLIPFTQPEISET